MKLPKNFEETALQRWHDCREFWGAWRTCARDDYSFIAGNQWEDDDEAILNEEDRPKVTFNYSEKMIDAVSGAEVSNRNEVKYFPREVNDSGLTDLWSDAAKWARDECNAEYEESDAFRDTLICGMGWTDTFLAYDDDLDGMLSVSRIDPLEMYSDPVATKPGVTDRRYDFRARWVDEMEVEKKYPGKVVGGGSDGAGMGGGIVRQGHHYDDAEDEENLHKGQVQLLQYECFYREPIIRVLDPDTQKLHELDDATFTQVKEGLDKYGIQYVRQMKKVYYQAVFAGEQLLESKISPSQHGFTRQCITGKRDRNKNTWYGLTRTMKDPQRWANKWLSQIMHIINSNAKGGIMAEIGAFVDPRKAQDEWSKADSVTLLKEGGIQKVKEKTMGNYPSGIDRLMEFALNSLPQVTGINLEALGLANREQAGVLEQQRKQAAYGLLAPLFDSLKRYRKEQGKVFLYFLQEYLSDGRLIRVAGDDGAQYIQLTKDKEAIRYDVVVGEAPDSPDSKNKTWEALIQLIPAMLKAEVPIPPVIFDYVPLPAALAQKWKQFAAQNSGKVSPEQMKKLQEQMQKLQQENMQLKMDQSMEQQELQQKDQAAQADFALKAKQMQQEHQLRVTEMEREFALKIKEMIFGFQIEFAKLNQDGQIKKFEAERGAEMNREKIVGDLKLKALATGVQATEDTPDLALKVDVAPLAEVLKKFIESNESMARDHHEAMAGLTKAMSAPKEATLPDGRKVRIGATKGK